MHGKTRRAYTDAAGYLCEYRQDIADAIGDTAWDTAAPVLRDADPFSPAWVEALRAVHIAAEAAGIPGGIGLGRVMGPGMPLEAPLPPPTDRLPPRWRCPDGRCSRVAVTDRADAGTAPLCALSGKPMQRGLPW